MKLIMRTEFENLRLNDDHGYMVDNNSGKEVLKIYMGDKLIAKRISNGTKLKRTKRYFGCKGYQEYLKDYTPIQKKQ